MKEDVRRELQRRGLAAANLPEGEPKRAAARDPVFMAEARWPRRERKALSIADQLRHTSLSAANRRCGTVTDD